MPIVKPTLDCVPEIELSELIYTLVMELSREQKREIPLIFLKKLNTAKKAAKFATESTLEQKREFLSYLGFYSFFTLIDGKDITPLNFREVFKDIKREKPKSMVEEMVKKGFYISSDLDFAHALTLLSAAKNSASYKMHMQLRRIGYQLKKWPKTLVNKNATEVVELYESDELVDSLIAGTLDIIDMVEAAANVEKEEFKVLLYLKQNIGTYKSYQDICDHFRSKLMKRAIAGAMRKMKERQLIQKHPDWQKREYTITKLGVRAVQDFKGRLYQSVNQAA